MTNLRYILEWSGLMDRLYDTVLERHFASNRQMAFVSGPRQVGKTTTATAVASRRVASTYLNWDIPENRVAILAGASEVAARADLDTLHDGVPLVVLDELHKAPDWKAFLKGLFDGWGDRAQFLVTGSGNLETFRSGGESLMGRYFPYRMHPLSVGELSDSRPPDDTLTRAPADIADRFEDLVTFGGFPEPLVRAEDTFHNRWQRLRAQQLVREEVSNLTNIQELDRLEILVELLRQQAGDLINYTSLAKQLRVAVDTVTRWLSTLSALYYCFEVRPWHSNVARALRKQPKYYLWDWSLTEDVGRRHENLVACALLKAAHLWTDLGHGEFGLHFIRDKQQNEVDFVVTRDGAPWFIVEVKSSSKARLSANLARFQDDIGAERALQVAFDAAYVDRNCFELDRPTIVPARTFLSQLP